ncbi:MAG: 8-oxo-dGTP diphosphatase [Patescibacteria group bacterium]
MNLSEFRNNYVKGLKKTTLGIIRNPSGEVCLAMKKRGFGAGKWNFSGGKVLPDETPEQCLVRETEEEFGVKIGNLRSVGILYFYFSDVPLEKNWNQKCYVFEAGTWDGEPQESEEMLPKWWRRDRIPYQEMWQEDKSWIEPALDGQVLTGRFLFTSKDVCLEKAIVIGKIIDE